MYVAEKPWGSSWLTGVSTQQLAFPPPGLALSMSRVGPAKTSTGTFWMCSPLSVFLCREIQRMDL